MFGLVVMSSRTMGIPLILSIAEYSAFAVEWKVRISPSLLEIEGDAKGLTKSCDTVVLPVLEAPQRLTMIVPMSRSSFNREATTAE